MAHQCECPLRFLDDTQVQASAPTNLIWFLLFATLPEKADVHGRPKVRQEKESARHARAAPRGGSRTSVRATRVGRGPHGQASA